MPNRLAKGILGKLVPAGLLTYFGFAWYICTFHIGYGYIYSLQKRRHFGLGYITAVQILIGSISRAYAHLLLLPRDHGAPSANPSARYLERQVIEVCSPAEACGRPSDSKERSGSDLPRCSKGDCNGRWKPPKTRHCGICGTCKVGFDHHCPWFDNCLTAAHYKPFLHLLLLTPIAVVLLTYPLWPILPSQIRLIYVISQADARTRQAWWDWWPSWMVFGGPVGRWVVGGWLGLQVLARNQLDNDFGRSRWGEIVERPGAAIMVLLLFGFALASITSGLAYFSIRTILAGELTIDGERRKAFRRLANMAVHLPSPLPAELIARLDALDDKLWSRARDKDGQIRIVQSMTGDEPYHLGRKNNWERVMGKEWSCLMPIYRSSGVEQEIWDVSLAYKEVLQNRIKKET